MQVLLFSAKPGRFDSDSSQASGHNIPQRAIGRQRKAEEELFGRVQTSVGHQERVIGNQEGMDLLSGLQISFSKPKDNQLLIVPTETD